MKPRILIYEDNAVLRSTLKNIFSGRGYEVFAFSEPERCQAFGSAGLTCPADFSCADIIISDVNMPTKSGLDLMRERGQKKCKTKYRALMSADWTDSDLKSAHELGCYIFHKPFDLKEMLKWLDDCCDELARERNSASSGSTADEKKPPQEDRSQTLQRVADL